MSNAASAFAAVLLALLLQQSLQGVAWAKAVPKEFFVEEGSGAPEKACHLDSLVIDFQRDFNYSFILFPRTVDIGACVGSCSAARINNHYDLLRKLTGKKAEEPCCVPTKFEPVVLATSINSNMRLNTVDNLKVSKCGCR